ncbi:MAG: hypothetical protein LUI08_03580 [Prevotella sp.]|nr:hypothetical protein [Prevotella sp.]
MPVMFDAVENYDQEPTKATLCRWQAAFFPLGFSEGLQIETGNYREAKDKTEILSGQRNCVVVKGTS